MATQLENNTAAMQSLLNTINNLPNASSIELDTTLTQAGMTADAKAVGDAIGVEIFNIDDIDPGIYSWSANAGGSRDVELDNATANRFRSLRNGQLIMLVKEGYALNACGTVTVVDGFVSFCCSSEEFSRYPTFYTGYMEADSNSMYFCSIVPSAAFHYHSVNELDTGMFNGAIAACQYDEYSQDPYTSLLRNTAILPEETDPEYDGEIYWTYE